MAKIEKKVWPEYFDAIASEKKTFELRLHDFEVKEGDTLILKEWDPETKEYTGREAEKSVGFVFVFRPDDLPFYSQKDVATHGLQIISLL